jgi:outer membrane immunogenic protein
MKRLLLSGAAAIAALVIAAPAYAADMPSRRAPVYKAAPLPIFNWTGFYAGLHAGYGWGDSSGLDPDGGFGGGQIGYNWQFSPNWVWGVEADVSGADLSDRVAGIGVKTNVFGTARVRLGYTVDRMMVYGTGGFAWADTKNWAGGSSDKQANYGWTIGAGLEYAFAPNWSTKLEYLYADYGRDDYNIPGGNGLELKTSTVKVGINYLFNTGGGHY